jgi:hypothetical protein
MEETAECQRKVLSGIHELNYNKLLLKTEKNFILT